jgi:vesicle-fusing ATPase
MASPQDLVCVNALNADLAIENRVYVNPANARTAYVCIGNFVYRAVPHPDVERGHIAMNAIQRRVARTFAGQLVEVFDFMVPVGRDYTIKAVTIEADYVKSDKTKEAPDLTHLANSIRAALLGDILTFGQTIVIGHNGDNILLWVKSDVRGLVTDNTEIGVDWRSGNT